MSANLKRLGTLLYVVRKGEEKFDYVGHTLLQKLVYLLEEAEGVDLGYRYKMYHYGPYCAEVWGDLNYLEDVDAVRIFASPDGYGYRIIANPGEPELEELDAYVGDDIKAKVEKLLSILGDKPVRSLECVATTHYAYRFLLPEENRSFASLEKVVRDLKPHLKKEEVAEAFDVLKSSGLLES